MHVLHSHTVVHKTNFRRTIARLKYLYQILFLVEQSAGNCEHGNQAEYTFLQLFIFSLILDHQYLLAVPMSYCFWVICFVSLSALLCSPIVSLPKDGQLFACGLDTEGELGACRRRPSCGMSSGKAQPCSQGLPSQYVAASVQCSGSSLYPGDSSSCSDKEAGHAAFEGCSTSWVRVCLPTTSKVRHVACGWNHTLAVLGTSLF